MTRRPTKCRRATSIRQEWNSQRHSGACKLAGRVSPQRRCMVMTSRLIQTTVLVVLGANAQSAFNKKLPADERILHTLNRLTFGAQPADVAEVRRVGLEKWIGMQLHPDSLVENPELEAKLKPLETLRLDTAAILKDYPAMAVRFPRPPMPPEIPPPRQYQRLLRGTPDERLAVLGTLDAGKRPHDLSLLTPQKFSRSPQLQKED